MKAIKYTKIIGLFLVSVFALTACKSDDGGGNPTPTPSNESVVLIWWNLFEPVENVQPLIDAYVELHPNVVIQYDEKGADGIEGYYDLLNEALGDGDALTTPDIFTVHNSWAGAYQEYIQPAPDGTFSTEQISDLYPVVQTDFVSDQVQGIPLYVDALGVIYNKDKLAQGGYTVPEDDWSNFQTQATRLTLKDAQNQITSAGFSAWYPDSAQFSFELLNLLMLQNGVEMLAEDGASLIADQAESQDAVSFYQQFINGNSLTWNDDQLLDTAAFLDKKLAMYVAPSWRVIDIANYNDAYNLGINFDTATVPQLGGNERINWATYWAQTVAKDSSHSAVAWDFLKFITEPEQLRTLGETVQDNGRPIGIIYPWESMASEISDEKYLSAYVQSMQSARSWRMGDGYRLKLLFDEEFASSNNVDVSSLENYINEVLNE